MLSATHSRTICFAAALAAGSAPAFGCYRGAQADPFSGSGVGEGPGGSETDSGDSGDVDPLPEAEANEVGLSGLRRLSIAEYRATVEDLVGVDPALANELLPIDTLSPFDNDYTLQDASEALIKGADLLAGDIAAEVIASETLRAQITPCEPSGAADIACFRSFIEQFGRRALRRDLTADEVNKYAALAGFGADANDFWIGISSALRAFLQHPEFLYRVEIGDEVPGQPELHRLNNFEIATRLSYFLTGSTPEDWLLDAASDGEFDDTEGIVGIAEELLDSPRARARINRFHALWLGYDRLGDEGVAAQMRTETNALVERVVFEREEPWTAMLTATETFVTPELAAHYGLEVPASEGWVSYGDSGRAGLLSQGAFLTVGSKFGDTSPTQRGLLVRTQLFCQEIPLPSPDLMVDIDEPPPDVDPDACKSERYYMANDPQCSVCHQLTDLIGFGLENYDDSGAFRLTEPGRPDCEITGEGDFVGVGAFNGPAELAALALESGLVEACVSKQLYRFAIGRTELDEHDEALIERLVVDASTDGGLGLRAFISQYVSSDAFRHRRFEVAQ